MNIRLTKTIEFNSQRIVKTAETEVRDSSSNALIRDTSASLFDSMARAIERSNDIDDADAELEYDEWEKGRPRTSLDHPNEHQAFVAGFLKGRQSPSITIQKEVIP